MKRLLGAGTCIALAIAFGGCAIASENGEVTGATASAITVKASSIAPWPVAAGTKRVTWGGSIVDLLMADALATCGRYNDRKTTVTLPGNNGPGSSQTVTFARWMSDPVLTRVVNQMQAQSCGPAAPSADALSRWRTLRADASCNVDRATNVNRKMALTQRADDGRPERIEAADDDLCMAQYLRANGTGTSGAALLLSVDERMRLLNAIRERAQLAMLTYARADLLAARFVPINPGLAWTRPDSETVRAGYLALGTWAQGASAATLKGVSDDLAQAVELHVTVTRELAALMAQSGSTAGADSRGGDAWAAGSWRQRVHALFYGGDPFADQRPGADANVTTGWPDATETPNPTIIASAPQVATLMSLARRHDALNVKRGAPASGSACASLDIGATAGRLYRAVEASLRTRRCVETVGGACQSFKHDDPELQGSTTSFLLRAEYGITPAHADLLVRQLSELLGLRCGSVALPGALNLAGTLTELSNEAGWEHLAADSEFEVRDARQTVPLYGRYGFGRLPTSFDHRKGPTEQAIYTDPNERLLGATAALAAVRETLEAASTSPSGAIPNLPALLTRKNEVFDVVRGAVGARSVVIEPTLPTSFSTRLQEQAKSADGTPRWTVTVTVPSADAWWTTDDPSGYQLVAVRDDGRVAEAALRAGNARLGADVASLTSTGVRGTTATATPGGSDIVRWKFDVALPTDGAWTLVVQRTSTAGSGYALLAADTQLPSTARLNDARYYAFEGTLGDFADRMRANDAYEPALPAYDGLGLRLRRVPPLDPIVLGGTANDTAFGILRSRAHNRATTASTAMGAAFTTLLNEARGQANLAIEAERSRAIGKLAKEQLCGASNSACEPTTRMITFRPPRELPVCPPGEDRTKKAKLACFAVSLHQASLAEVPLLGEVANALLDGTIPNFATYPAGRLRSVMQEQWDGATRMKDASRNVSAAYLAANAALTEQDDFWAAHRGMREQICNYGGFRYSHDIDDDDKKARFEQDVKFQEWQQRKSWCEQLDAQLAQDQVQGTSRRPYYDASLRLGESGLQLHEAVAALRRASAAGLEAVNDANLAIAKAKMEASLVEAGEVTRFDMYKRFHARDVEDAFAAQERAREAALDLRRAVEARYVVNLSAATPWADEVYGFDLGTSGGATGGGIIPSRLDDYVTKLEDWMVTYASTHPSNADQQGYVITLPGPLGAGVAGRVNTVPVGVVDANAYAWSVACGTDSPAQWRAIPASNLIADACPGSAPTRARLAFTLTPLGRPSLAVFENSANRRFNARWARVAVNLVGSGIIDCTLAADPADCGQSQVVTYDLRHAGRSYATSWEGAWMMLGMPEGHIVQATALADGLRWLNPVSFGWGHPDVVAVAKAGFAERPLGGQYEVEFALKPETRLEQVDRVQVLVGETAWVRQGQ